MTTTLGDTDVADLARRLYEAERTRVPIRQISLEHPEMTIEDSYAVQRELIRLKVADGAVSPVTDAPGSDATDARACASRFCAALNSCPPGRSHHGIVLIVNGATFR